MVSFCLNHLSYSVVHQEERQVVLNNPRIGLFCIETVPKQKKQFNRFHSHKYFDNVNAEILFSRNSQWYPLCFSVFKNRLSSEVLSMYKLHD